MSKKLLTLLCCLFASVAFSKAIAVAPTIKVYLMAGQSNMLERNYFTDLPAAMQPPLYNVSWNVNGDYNHSWFPLVYGPSSSIYLFGPEASLGYELTLANPTQKYALIKTAKGATALSDRWRSPSAGGTTGDLWTSFIQNTNSALAVLQQQNPGYDIEIAGMLWMQGETDASGFSTAYEYESNLTAFIKDIRSQYNLPSLPFVISMIDATGAWPYSSIVRAAEQSVAQKVANVRIFDTHGFQTDGFHYKPLGCLQMGYQFSRAILGTLNVMEWNFNYWREGWNLINAASITQNNGTIDVNIVNNAGDDPYIMTDPFLSFDPSLYKSVVVRMKNATTDQTARLSWYKSDGSLGDIQSFSINSNDPNFTDYYINLANTSWNGDIKSLKLNFVNNGQAGKITIDYIKLLTTTGGSQSAPSVIVPTDISVSTGPGVCSAVVNYSATVSSDDPNTQVTYSIPSGSTFPKGVSVITVTATNSSSLSTSKTFKVTVTDREAPVPDLATLPDITRVSSTTVSTRPTATDNCVGKIMATTSSPLTYTKPGTYAITWTYSDSSGNSAAQTQKVIITDNLAPVPDLATLPDVTAACAATVSTTPTATDNFAGKVTGKTGNLLTYNKPGTYTITWTYSDSSGNAALQTQKVIVTDNIAPVPDIASLADITSFSAVTVSVFPIATDNCTGKITATTSNPLTYNKPGTYTITWNYNDGNGNTASQTQKVVISDNLPPVPDVPVLSDVIGTCNATVSTYPMATDNFAGKISATTGNPLTYAKRGTYTIIWTYSDGYGNTASQTQKVTVLDSIAPVPDMATLPDITGTSSGTVTTFPTATDNCAGKINGTTTNPLTYSQPGTYTITWNYSDGNGNLATQTQKVVVTTNTAPVPDVAVLADVTGTCSATLAVRPTATAYNGGKITGTTSNPLTYSKPGTYTITWTYTDSNGNIAAQTQKVIVTDNVAPVPNAAALPDITGTCSVTVSTYPTATDNCAGTVTATTSNPLIYSKSGIYAIIWTYNDGNGNIYAQTQRVIVTDNTAPVPSLSTLPDITGTCSVIITAYPTATDDCAGKITATTGNPLSYTKSGTYNITWVYNDGNGNSATQTQKVIVTDTTAPVPSLSALPDITGSCSVTVSSYPTATDNCAGKITATTTNPLTYNKSGTYTITWTYNDGNGNSSNQTQTVIVTDNIAPVPDITTLANVTSTSSLVISVKPTATDNCVGKIMATTSSPLTYTKPGTYAITWTYSDSSGNSAAQTQKVIITDNLAPVPDLATLPDVTAACAATVSTTPTATDNFAGKVTGKTGNPLTYNKPGTYTITWTYSDSSGNAALQTQKVIVTDNIAPVPDIASLTAITGNCSVAIASYPTATDNCAGKIIATTSDALTYSKPGVYTITWTYSDGNGNTATQTQTITVIDNTAPVPDVSALPDIIGGASTVVVTAPSATDNCTGKITGSTKDPLAYSKAGTYTLTWTYSDGNGNTATQLQKVIISDNQAPVPDVSILPDIKANCSITISAFPTATDNFAGKVTGTTSNPLTYTKPGNYIITWNYLDGNGNSALQTQKVTVIDSLAPVPDKATLADITGTCTATVSIYPTASDNCVGKVTASTSDPISYTKPGTYIITWTYTDGNNNYSSQTQRVIVTDNTPPVPVLSVLPDVSGVSSATVTTFPTATDNCASKVITSTKDSLAYNKPGTYTITWTYDDGNGNKSTQQQKVIVIDNQPPVPDAALLSDVTGSCTAVVTAFPTATDNFSGKVTGTTTDTLNYTKPGTYFIIWTFKDASGNAATQTQKVTVTDVIAPVPVLTTLPDIKGNCSVTVSSFPKATDNCAGLITGTTSSSLTYSKSGTYTITWTYTDNNNNAATQIQKVIVVDSIAPVPDVTVLPDISGSAATTVTAYPTATDNCAGKITATTNTSLNFAKPGNYTIAWNYSDGNSNSAFQTQKIILTDNLAPVPDNSALPTLTGDCSVTVAGAPTAKDNFAGTVTAVTSNPLTYNKPGTYTITWTYNDGNGNSAVQIQKVIVVDNLAPVPDVATLPQITAVSSTNITAYPTATDKCEGKVTATTSDPLTYTKQGTYNITWTYNDGNGNSTSQIQKVVISSSSDPVPNLSLNDVSQNEGNSGTSTFTFTVSLSSPAGPGGVTFNIATANGTATAGTDYVAKSLTSQTIPAGSAAYTFTVAVNGDVSFESNETFFVNLTGVTGANVLDGQGMGTILNDDALPNLTINDVSQNEGNSGTSTFTFTVSLSSPAGPGGVTFNIATANGTAMAGTDYVAKSLTSQTIPAGSAAYSFTVTVNGDVTVEPNELFFLNITNVSGALETDIQGKGTIANDDGNCPLPDFTPPVIVTKDITVLLDATGRATIKPSDVIQSVSDGCGVDNTSYQVSLASFDCSNVTSVSSLPDHQAYTGTVTTGNQSWGGELGLEFKVNNASGITINQLGAFDHQSNGIVGTQSGGIRVAVFNKATQTIVPGLDVIIAGTADHFSGNYRMKDITPVTLLPGNYVVVAKGYNANELNGNSIDGVTLSTMDDGSGAVSYTGGGLYGNDFSTTLNYPANPDGGPMNRYLAGTFIYKIPIISGGVSSSHQAYKGTVTTGNQNWGGELGLEFKVNNASGITINQLGAFDHQSNGIVGTQSGGIRVAVFNKATQTIVPGLDVIIAGTADHFSGNYRMKDITPVTLLPGNYVVVAKGYNANELNGNSIDGVTLSTMDDGSGAVSYTGGGLYGSDNLTTFSYPTNVDGGPANRYLAGTFVYNIPGSTNVVNTGTIEYSYIVQRIMNKAQTDAFATNAENSITNSNSNTVTVTVKDNNGNIGQATANVIVVDNTVPIITPKNITVQADSKGHATIKPLDVIQSITDNCMVDSSTITVSTTAFDCPGETFNHQAYTGTVTTGNQSWGGELGLEFKVNNASGITINQLGAFDHQSNGIVGTQSGGIRVAVFNKATQTIVPGLDVIIAGTADHFSGNYRMKDITPVTLLPGNYVVVAKGYNANELNGNSIDGVTLSTMDDGSGAVSYTGGGLYGNDFSTTLNYPANPDGGPANRYLAGTFTYVKGGGSGSAMNIVKITVADNHGNVGSATATVTLVCRQSAQASTSMMPATLNTSAASEVPEYVKLFPNPTYGEFKLQLNNHTSPTLTIQITNVNGKLIEQRHVDMSKAASSTIYFNLNNQPPGMYLVKLISVKEVQVIKVMVMR